MFGRSRKSPPAGASLKQMDLPAEIEDEAIADEDVPTFESPHVVLLRQSRGGPYYLTPDSAEPLPSGMWADLDPKVVEQESTRMADLLDDGKWRMGTLEPDLRDFLLDDGVVGRKVIQILGGDEDENSLG